MSPDHFLLVAAAGQAGLLLLMLLSASSRFPGALYLSGVLGCFMALFFVVLAKDFGWPGLVRLDAPAAMALAAFLVMHNRALINGRAPGWRADLIWFSPALLILAAQAFAPSAVLINLMLTGLAGAFLYCAAALIGHFMQGASVESGRQRTSRLAFCAHAACLVVVALGLAQHFAEILGAGAMSGLWTRATLAAFLGLAGLTALAQGKDARLVVVGAPRPPRNSLSDAEIVRLHERLQRAMSHDQLYRNHDLQLADLADRLGVSPDAVSEAVRRGLGANFFDFVNARRIDDAKARLASTNDSIERIMFEAGFNSKSSFYAEFKKRTGDTPGQYRRRRSL